MIWQHIIIFILFIGAIFLMVWPFIKKPGQADGCGSGCKGCSAISSFEESTTPSGKV